MSLSSCVAIESLWFPHGQGKDDHFIFGILVGFIAVLANFYLMLSAIYGGFAEVTDDSTSEDVAYECFSVFCFLLFVNYGFLFALLSTFRERIVKDNVPDLSALTSLTDSPGQSEPQGRIQITVRLGESIGMRTDDSGYVVYVVPGGQLEKIGGINVGDRIVEAGGTSLGTAELGTTTWMDQVISIIQEKTNRGEKSLRS